MTLGENNYSMYLENAICFFSTFYLSWLSLSCSLSKECLNNHLICKALHPKSKHECHIKFLLYGSVFTLLLNLSSLLVRNFFAIVRSGSIT